MRVCSNLFSRILLAVVLCALATGILHAQSGAGRAGFGFTAGGAKYWGEFSDNSLWFGGDVFFRYNPLPYLSLQAGVGLASVRYKITQDNYIQKYPDYFGPNASVGQMYPGTTNLAIEEKNNTRILTYEALATLNILPNERFVPFVFGGVGFMSFEPRAGESGGADRSLPNNRNDVYDKTGLIFPVGLGFEFYATDDFVINGRGTFRFTNTDFLDDFASNTDGKNFKPSRNSPDIGTATANDAFVTFGFGLTYYVFGNADYDKDGLTNAQERLLGTDENNPDTDGDGLPDGFEVKGSRAVPNGMTEDYINSLPETDYRTDPLKGDTDGDGLSDKDELVIHRTNPTSVDTDADGLKDGEELARKTKPLVPDTDGDGLLDGDEVNTHKTDPLQEDTDGDGLRDGDEIRQYNTSPNNMDSDADGLKDGDEVNTHKTNPSRDDTDNDGLKDGDELNRYKTDANNADTDGDLLSDGDEVNKYKSDPLKTDTDGDSLSDGDEVNKYKINPISGDTDNDGLGDGLEVNKHKTNPADPDSDKDGLRDGDEVNRYKTDPLNVDSDNDALKDGDEVNTHKTNPALADTDGDSLIDGDEVNRTKTNPLDPDTDKDSVRDDVDKCPLIPGEPTDGCPPKPKPNTVTNFPGILFIVNTDKFDLTVPGTIENLNKIKALVEQCPDLKVEIEGHASSEGEAKRNQELSEMRAAAVKSWLVQQGVDPSKVVNTIGYGSTKPLIPEPKQSKKVSADQVEAARKQNRRIAVRVVETCK